MRTFLFIIFVFGAYFFGKTQELVSSSGKFSINNFGSITWTMGEVSINTLQNNSLSALQGFQQPWSKRSTGISAFEDISISIKKNQ